MRVAMADGKQDVLDMLRELAELTMLEEGDPQSFRVRAYESAAQAIAAQATDLGRLTAKELQQIEGIGKSTAEKIRELLETGQGREAGGAARQAPAQRGGAAAHPGPRPQGAASGCAPSWACSRSTICARVLAEHKLRALSGFGQKSEEKLAAGAGAPRGAGADGAHAHLGGAAAGRAHRGAHAARSRASPTPRPAARCAASPRPSATSTSWSSAPDAGAGDGGAGVA